MSTKREETGRQFTEADIVERLRYAAPRGLGINPVKLMMLLEDAAHEIELLRSSPAGGGGKQDGGVYKASGEQGAEQDYEAPRDSSVALKVRGVGRDAAEPRSLCVALTERPTDDEIRSLQDYLRGWPWKRPDPPGPASDASVNKEDAAFNANVDRLKACEHIADGDEGWEVLRNECPSTAAVARLRDTVDGLKHERNVLQRICAKRAYALDDIGEATVASEYLPDLVSKIGKILETASSISTAQPPASEMGKGTEEDGTHTPADRSRGATRSAYCEGECMTRSPRNAVARKGYCPKRGGIECETQLACAAKCLYADDPIHPNRIVGSGSSADEGGSITKDSGTHTRVDREALQNKEDLK